MQQAAPCRPFPTSERVKVQHEETEEPKVSTKIKGTICICFVMHSIRAEKEGSAHHSARGRVFRGDGVYTAEQKGYPILSRSGSVRGERERERESDMRKNGGRAVGFSSLERRARAGRARQPCGPRRRRRRQRRWARGIEGAAVPVEKQRSRYGRCCPRIGADGFGSEVVVVVVVRFGSAADRFIVVILCESRLWRLCQHTVLLERMTQGRPCRDRALALANSPRSLSNSLSISLLAPLAS